MIKIRNFKKMHHAFMFITAILLLFVCFFKVDYVSAASVDSFKGKLKVPSPAPVSQQYSSKHRGVDYAGQLGSPIYAAYGGKVVNAGDSNENGKGYGNWIVINHSGIYTIYGHMRKDGILVKVGQYVKKGDLIAKVGNEGDSTGPHLHFSISSTYPKFTYQDLNLFFEPSGSVPSDPEKPYVAKGKITEPAGFNVRNVPKATATRIGGVYKNNVVDIVARNSEWYKIKFGKGYGYIMAVKGGLQVMSSTPAPPNNSDKPYVAKGKVTEPAGFNVRSVPKTTATRIGGVYKGNIVDITAKNGDWYKIKFGKGYGYIMAVKSGLQILNSGTTKPTNSAFEEALAYVLEMEGGWSDNSSDRGGQTNMGVTQPSYDKYRDWKKLSKRNVKYITKAEAKELYYQFFWKEVKGDKYERSLAIVMFDTAVYVGPYGSTAPYRGGAIKFLQQTLGLYGDGSWGGKTETAFTNLPRTKHYNMALKILELRKQHHYEDVRRNPTQKTFLEGWLNRTDKLTKYIKKNYG